ncbi:helix-turn-helix transcriptional regulator [Virgibacillus halodenitrificans]|uniref:helix-turn-helix domain-containing protein n=1 Tax=Virgibacillus halodenitrificans TaxID=1482 RepID=UPI0024BF5DA5|nr:helix-turn-helix transcriptional regulator [Virgibacillus halodenitrificans]WHX25138.1 helix-turn-helix transcriptional regulator [Virgibacillus halodenitrificans]
MISKNFGEEIKTARMYNNLTIREAAKRIGLSHSYLSQIENNKRSVPSPEVIKKIATGLNTDYYYLLSVAGYNNEAYKTLSYLKKLIDEAPEKFKIDFMKTHDPHIKKLIENRKKVSKKLPSPEVFIRFPNTFFINSEVHDYLRLMRLNKGLSTKEIAEKLGIKEEEYIKMESEMTYSSPELKQHSTKLGEIFGVEEFKDWLLFVFTETPNQNFVNDYTPEEVMKEITVTVPSVIKKYDSDGKVFFQSYNEEQLRQNFSKLEHILSDDRLLTYYGRVLTSKDKQKILRMMEVLFE